MSTLAILEGFSTILALNSKFQAQNWNSRTFTSVTQVHNATMLEYERGAMSVER